MYCRILSRFLLVIPSPLLESAYPSPNIISPNPKEPSRQARIQTNTLQARYDNERAMLAAESLRPVHQHAATSHANVGPGSSFSSIDSIAPGWDGQIMPALKKRELFSAR